MNRTRGRLRPWLALSAAVGLCVALAVAELADVYLKSGVKLRGDVTMTETEVVVRNDLGEVRYPKEQVARVVPAAETRPAPATQPTTVEPQGERAERPDTRPERDAAPAQGKPLPAAPLLSALDIQRLKMSELGLDGPPERVRVRFGEKANQLELPRRILRELSARPDYRKEWADILLRGQPHEKLQLIVATTGLKHADQITIVKDPEVFATFRTHVLPTVLKGCARSGCHTGDGAAAFRFPDGPTRSEEYVYTTFLLLDRVQASHGPLIDRDDPEGSVLLDYMLPEKDNPWAHPPVEVRRRLIPALRSRDNATYRRIVDWMNSLRVPHPDYELDYAFGAAPPAREANADSPEESRAPGGAERPTDSPTSQPVERP